MGLPEYFQPLFGDLDFTHLDPHQNKQIILTRVINYGNLKHWKWIKDFYGKDLKKSLELIPRSEFRKPAQSLAKIIYNLDDFKYASRSDYIRSKKTN